MASALCFSRYREVGSSDRAEYHNVPTKRFTPLFLVNIFLGNDQDFGDTGCGQTT
jgi:hypothetical protein